MWLWIVEVLALIVSAGMCILIRHRIRRVRTLAELADRRSEWVLKHPIRIVSSSDRIKLSAEFAQKHLIRIDDFLSSDDWQLLRSEAEENIPRMIASYIPTHKKGHTLSYEHIHRYAHGCLGFYHSRDLEEWVSEIVGMPVKPTPDRDQSSLSVLCYKNDGDHINWHFDHNFYQGRHFTVLLSLANQSATGGLSQGQLMIRTPNGDETINTSPNTLVLFEGSKVLHRAAPTAEGDLRLILSMTFCADSRTNWLKEIARRCKDTAFYGIRALWD